ncbi:hypothetical protein D9757_004891 [Collybiopsis confluens]|uniref:JmjC domain-containing protein n=1 Tax=Collybiopsis confluens TaxID=2823264 RepID=A0A8H5HT60_9AGAR|nr:hypothetical protein D9757_004891 [Collybiopsis confluens]
MTEFRISSATSTKWTNDYLAEKMGDLPISVAVTPNGWGKRHADAVTQHPDGRLYFAEPLIEKMTMKSFLGKLSEDTVPKMETVYLQSQNGNLFSNLSFEGVQDSSEFVPLRKDVPSELKWCSEALDRGIDAVNLWIGDGNSVSSIHSDPYENIYTVVRGQKHFTLLPPPTGCI